MDRPSLPPIESQGKVSALDLDALVAIADDVRRDVTPVLAKRFAGTDVVRAIREVSVAYTRERGRLRSGSRGPSALAARLAFFLPRDVVKSAELARQTHAVGAFPARETLRVLDLGAGLGATSLGVARYAARAALARRFEIVAVDDDASALAVLADVFATARDLEVTVESVTADLARHLARETRTFDLVVAGLALNELAAEARARLVAQMLGRTSEDGLVLVVEPALAETARALSATRDALVLAGARVVFPCTHAAPCPMLEGERDWCHVDLPIPLDAVGARLAREAGLRDERPTFAGLVLARSPGADEGAKAHRIVSAPLGSKGRTEIHACGPGGLVRLRQLDRHAKEAPVRLDALRRGSLVTLGAEGDVTTVRVP